MAQQQKLSKQIDVADNNTKQQVIVKDQSNTCIVIKRDNSHQTTSNSYLSDNVHYSFNNVKMCCIYLNTSKAHRNT